MKITKKQIDILQESKTEKFVQLTVIFIQTNFKAFAEKNTEEELKIFVLSIVNFCKTYKIYGGINLQKMTHYFIFYHLNLPLDEKILNVLRQYNLNEDSRVQDFYLILASGRYKLSELTLN